MSTEREHIVDLEDDTPDRRGVREWMGREELTLVLAAGRLGCCFQHLSRWLRHEVEGRPETWERWGEVSGVPVGDFVEGRLAGEHRRKRGAG